MSGGGKSVTAGSEARSEKGVGEKKGKMAALGMRKAMNFDPKPRVLHGEKEVDEYLASYVSVYLPKWRWSGVRRRSMSQPPAGSVYFHPHILVLGVKLPMTPFVRDVLAHFKAPPSQLTSGA